MIPFLRYAKSKFEKEQELLAFRLYVTDMLYYQANGETLLYRYADLINDNLDIVNEDNVDDVINDIIQRAGLEVT